MKSIIIGTAGHIDHGKTTLVRALTGTDADRLPEEKRRGITIDLGFAELDVKNARLGFVDVPGHERFVKNMLAGAHGIDAVMLVIAADEGVMPQTREHFEICRLLDVKAGCVCLTKVDAVDDELLELVRAEAAELVTNSFLEHSPVIAVSARTGRGIEELKKVLGELAQHVPARDAAHVARLPVDRVFTMRGFGTIATGTLVAGEIVEGAELEILPSGKQGRVRGVQTYGQPVKRARAGHRTAVNLGGIETSELERGAVLAPPARLAATQAVDVHLEVLKDAPRPLRSRQRVRVHIGAAEVLARVAVLETAGEINAGDTGFVQLRFEKPVVAVACERFIVRSYSPSRTIAGGAILHADAPRHRRRELADVHHRLKVLHTGTDAARVAVYADIAAPQDLSFAHLARLTGWTDAKIKQVVSEAATHNLIVEAHGAVLSTHRFDYLVKRTVAALHEFHRREPLARGLARETLREQVFTHATPEVFRFVLAYAEQRELISTERDTVREARHAVEVSDEEKTFQNAVETLYRRGALEPLSVTEMLAQISTSTVSPAQQHKLLQLLIDQKRLVRVTDELLFHPEAINLLRDKVKHYAATQTPDRAIDVAAFKDLANVSRKYAIPLLEYFDRERVTLRRGDKRIVL